MIQSPIRITDFNDLKLKHEQFSDCLVFINPDEEYIIHVRQVLVINPGVKFVLLNDGAVDTKIAMDFIQEGGSDIIACDDTVAIQGIVSRLAPGSPESEFELYQKLCNAFRDIGIISNSVEMAKVFALVTKVATSNSTVLIFGESGTGKELIARSIHHFSSRRPFHFVAVNTGAIPENLLEDELFGHVKGSFTSAVKDRKGKFEFADKGTIFLDEISTMSPFLQVKLLRILQEREFERIGDNTPVKTDVRVISATNQKLDELVKNNTFREDLYYRLNVIPIQLPPLRERKIDVPILANFFLLKYCDVNQLPRKSLSLPAIRLLQQYNWPGNVRELENVIERLVVLNPEKSVIQPQDIPDEMKAETFLPTSRLPMNIEEIPEDGISLNDVIQDIERTLILKSLEKTDWNKLKAAKLLKIKRTTLIEKIKKMQK